MARERSCLGRIVQPISAHQMWQRYLNGADKDIRTGTTQFQLGIKKTKKRANKQRDATTKNTINHTNKFQRIILIARTICNHHPYCTALDQLARIASQPITTTQTSSLNKWKCLEIYPKGEDFCHHYEAGNILEIFYHIPVTYS